MALEGGEGSVMRLGRSLPPGKNPVPITQEAGWAPGQVWIGAENLAPTRIRSPDHPARSQSLYLLSYPAHIYIYIYIYNCTQSNTIYYTYTVGIIPPLLSIHSFIHNRHYVQ